jgi:hypothetical protein
MCWEEKGQHFPYQPHHDRSGIAKPCAQLVNSVTRKRLTYSPLIASTTHVDASLWRACCDILNRPAIPVLIG